MVSPLCAPKPQPTPAPNLPPSTKCLPKKPPNPCPARGWRLSKFQGVYRMSTSFTFLCGNGRFSGFLSGFSNFLSLRKERDTSLSFWGSLKTSKNLVKMEKFVTGVLKLETSYSGIFVLILHKYNHFQTKARLLWSEFKGATRLKQRAILQKRPPPSG